VASMRACQLHVKAHAASRTSQLRKIVQYGEPPSNALVVNDLQDQPIALSNFHIVRTRNALPIREARSPGPGIPTADPDSGSPGPKRTVTALREPDHQTVHTD